MKFIDPKLITIILLVISMEAFQSLSAQTTTLATGGDATNNSGSISYSVGQVSYSSGNGSNGSVKEGVQQPYEISVVSGIDEVQNITLHISVYPNPVSNDLSLDIKNISTKELYYQLHNVNGELLEKSRILSDHTCIKTTKLTPAIYFLKIIRNNNALKIFKIVKN